MNECTCPRHRHGSEGISLSSLWNLVLQAGHGKLRMHEASPRPKSSGRVKGHPGQQPPVTTKPHQSSHWVCMVGSVVENEVCQAVVVVMPEVQKNDQLNWIGGVNVCAAAVMWNLSGSGERKWRRRGEVEMHPYGGCGSKAVVEIGLGDTAGSTT